MFVDMESYDIVESPQRLTVSGSLRVKRQETQKGKLITSHNFIEHARAPKTKAPRGDYSHIPEYQQLVLIIKSAQAEEFTYLVCKRAHIADLTYRMLKGMESFPTKEVVEKLSNYFGLDPFNMEDLRAIVEEKILAEIAEMQ